MTTGGRRQDHQCPPCILGFKLGLVVIFLGSGGFSGLMGFLLPAQGSHQQYAGLITNEKETK